MSDSLILNMVVTVETELEMVVSEMVSPDVILSSTIEATIVEIGVTHSIPLSFSNATDFVDTFESVDVTVFPVEISVPPGKILIL